MSRWLAVDRRHPRDGWFIPERLDGVALHLRERDSDRARERTGVVESLLRPRAQQSIHRHWVVGDELFDGTLCFDHTLPADLDDVEGEEAVLDRRPELLHQPLV